jgi:hypothetical protein
MTYRERRLRRADRLDGWAEKRLDGVEAVRREGDRYRGDIAFATQPGRIPERERLNRREARAHESAVKAAGMSSRADTIRAQVEHAIYSDDEDAVERLEARIAELEAERDRWTRYNAACRAAKACTAEALAILDDRQRASLESVVKYAPYQLRKFGQAPSYTTSNLSGNIGKQRARLELLQRAPKGDDDGR